MNESRTIIEYENHWDEYARNWKENHQDKQHIGDEWIGKQAGAAQSLQEYVNIIENKFIAPYIKSHHQVLEIGIGGGRTAEILLKYCQNLICADISQQMLSATEKRLNSDRVNYIKLDGITLDNIPSQWADVCFCYDTMVHLEPRDIFNYLTRIPNLLKGDKICIFHHGNILTELGWQRFLGEWSNNLQGRHGVAFSVMTDNIMEKFLHHLNYKIILKDTTTVPRDCVWICQAP